MEHSNGNKDEFIKIETLLKIAFPLLILLGVVNLTAYYSYFKLPILNYLTFPEIITLFLENIIYYLYLLLPAFLLLAVRKDKNNDIVLWCLLIMFVVISIIMIINENKNYGVWKAYTVLILFITYLPTFLLVKSITKNSSKERSDISKYFSIWAIVFFVGALLATSIISAIKASDVKSHHIFSGTEIVLEDQVFVSNNHIYFIGKTENYIFLYDEFKEAPVILPISKVNRIIFKSRKIKKGMDSPYSPPTIP